MEMLSLHPRLPVMNSDPYRFKGGIIMRSKSLFAAMVLGLAGLLSGCVSETGTYYGYNGYNSGYYGGGYYGGGVVVYGGSNRYRPYYRPYNYRYRNYHRGDRYSGDYRRGRS